MVTDWQDRLKDTKIYGYNIADTLVSYNYEYPKGSLDKVVINCCKCGVRCDTYRSGDFYHRFVLKKREYYCQPCGALRREEKNYSRYGINWVERCLQINGYQKEETLKQFGYEVPSRGTDHVCVSCISCKHISEQDVLEFWRNRDTNYKCKVCVGKEEFEQRKDNMFTARDEFWAKEENRFWASELAKSQSERRSQNMKLLNESDSFQNLRLKGFIDARSDESKGEIEILEFVKSLGFPDAKKKRFGVTKEQNLKGEKRTTSEIDILIENVRIGIEHNGVYYHSTRNKNKNYHYNKYHLFKTYHDIKLIQIWEHEWILRQEQVKNKLRSSLGMNTNRIYARNCTVVDVPKTIALDFINREHIQVCWPSLFIKAFGLVHNDEIIACAIFSRHHRTQNELILQRVAFKGGLTVVGGLSRLSHHAYEFFKQPISSWCDLRWSSGNGYEKAGWQKVSQLPPDYIYVRNFRGSFQVISKQSRKKKLVNTPDGMTEKQHAELDGLHQLYDCGKLKYIYDAGQRLYIKEVTN